MCPKINIKTYLKAEEIVSIDRRYFMLFSRNKGDALC